MSKQLELAFIGVVALADQIIAISSGVLALSVTFLKDIVKEPSRREIHLLACAWVGYLLSIVAGIWTRMAAVGSLAKGEPVVAIGVNIRIPAGIQIVLFVLATTLFILFGIRALVRCVRKSS